MRSALPAPETAMSDFSRRSYQMTATCGIDELTVAKGSHSDWTAIEMDVNGHKSLIEIRSREHLSVLHTMIGDVLGASQ